MSIFDEFEILDPMIPCSVLFLFGLICNSFISLLFCKNSIVQMDDPSKVQLTIGTSFWGSKSAAETLPCCSCIPQQFAAT